jgi:LPPG:FO 2-phospho-L-lactate transferase
MTHTLAISGGVGGAKLALGLARTLEPDALTIVANTGDDFDHLGLRICPDLDTVMYTLADLSNRELGWGLAGETWQFLEALAALGGETWFRLGDRDLATHIRRRQLLDEGHSLSSATGILCEQLGVAHPVWPMTDQSVPTTVHLKEGVDLSFQHYFVRDRCEPTVSGFTFAGVDRAEPSVGLRQALTRPDLGAVVICPSNPFVSVDPVLAIPEVADLMRDAAAPVIAVSPIIGGEALKGPAAKMMRELGVPNTATAVAQHYGDLLDGFVIDETDRALETELSAVVPTIVTNTVMVTLEDRIRLAQACLRFSESLGTHRQ